MSCVSPGFRALPPSSISSRWFGSFDPLKYERSDPSPALIPNRVHDLTHSSMAERKSNDSAKKDSSLPSSHAHSAEVTAMVPFVVLALIVIELQEESRESSETSPDSKRDAQERRSRPRTSLKRAGENKVKCNSIRRSRSDLVFAFCSFENQFVD
jgi:hypothetical protein